MVPSKITPGFIVMKKYLYSTLLVFLSLFIPLIDLTAYVRPATIERSVWESLSPYFLPEDHPAKPMLDEIFTRSRATLNAQTMKDAGFYFLKTHNRKRAAIVANDRLPGYVVKLYLDDQKGMNEWPNYVKRIHGMIDLKEAIARHHYEHIFILPNKWIYPLPEQPVPPNNGHHHKKHFILVAEKLDIVQRETNLRIWKGQYPGVTQEKLKALYILVKELGLIDTIYPRNIPFTHDGYIAIVDTEFHGKWPIPYGNFVPYLSSEMGKYWKKLYK
jgi:hypothetical protein